MRDGLFVAAVRAAGRRRSPEHAGQYRDDYGIGPEPADGKTGRKAPPVTNRMVGHHRRNIRPEVFQGLRKALHVRDQLQETLSNWIGRDNRETEDARCGDCSIQGTVQIGHTHFIPKRNEQGAGEWQPDCPWPLMARQVVRHADAKAQEASGQQKEPQGPVDGRGRGFGVHAGCSVGEYRCSRRV